MRNVPTLAPAALTAFLALAPATAQEQAPLDAKSLAQRVEVAASPVHAFRYNQPIPAPNQTKPLLTRRRAFYPGETRLALVPPAPGRDPRRARCARTSSSPCTTSLGAKLADLGEAALSAAPAGVSGTLEWTVPEVAEGQYLLAARFSGEDGSRPRHPQQRGLRDPGVPAAPGRGAGGARPRAAEGRDGRRPRPRRQPALDRDARRGRRDALVGLRPGAARLGLREAAARDREGVRRPSRGGRGPVEGPHRRLHEGVPLRDRRHAAALRAVRAAFLRRGEGVADDGGPARVRLESPAPPAAALRPRQRPGRAGLRRHPHRRRLPRRRLHRARALRPGRVGRLQRHRRGRRAAGHGARAEGLQRRPRPGAPHRPLDGRRRHLADRPALPRPLRLDLAGVRRRGHGPHALDGRLERARPGAHVPDRRLAARGERGEPAGVRLPRRRGRRGERRRVAEDDGVLREGRPRREKRPLLRAAGGHPLLVGLRLPRRLAVPAGGGDPPQPVPRARRLLDVLAALQQGLLAPRRPDRPRLRARPGGGDAEGGCLRREGRQRLRLLPAALPVDRARGESRSRCR